MHPSNLHHPYLISRQIFMLPTSLDLMHMLCKMKLLSFAWACQSVAPAPCSGGYGPGITCMFPCITCNIYSTGQHMVAYLKFLSPTPWTCTLRTQLARSGIISRGKPQYIFYFCAAHAENGCRWGVPPCRMVRTCQQHECWIHTSQRYPGRRPHPYPHVDWQPPRFTLHNDWYPLVTHLRSPLPPVRGDYPATMAYNILVSLVTASGVCDMLNIYDHYLFKRLWQRSMIPPLFQQHTWYTVNGLLHT